MNVIKETYGLVKELVTLKSPVEVYVYTVGIFLAGLMFGRWFL